MILIKGFCDYRLKIDTNEVFSLKDGEEVLVKPCKDSKVKSWYLYRNGERVRKSIWVIYYENRDEILHYVKFKAGILT